ncbi:hypothetical protein A9Q93_04385 [Nonlabens dokdonensis]|uniref:Alkyl hydroperoxide reductase subunit C/ Thiol specific antioxidant domain-containing protein n=1 Tax=Nonlabens dokdonensis TaxID=328515 RepID=A0A1Z8B606_9FLAO|nr:redoxin domain-containing protein [Nonlabens dokdonensis]OUS18007.1 hypothetical protein A9Q93_04385 [Nonlabens dokdonensis]
MFDIISLSRKRNQYILHATLLIGCLLFLTSCEKKVTDNTATITITGKIINPINDYVVIRNYMDVLDTLELNKKGVFEKKYENIATGFYTFVHGNEYQSFYVAPGKSIRWRLNTKAFDESLAFTGAAAKENNYLIKLFLETEVNNRKILSEYQREPIDFKKMIDSLTKRRIKDLDNQGRNDDFSAEFMEGAARIIEFNSWTRLERYAYTHFGKNEILKSDFLPSNFYAHRHKLKINNTKLLNKYTFRPYVSSLVSNIALYNCALKHGSGKQVDRNGYEYKSEKLRVIDSLFDNETLKSLFAATETKNFIRSSKKIAEINKIVDQFVDLSQDEKLKNEITKMAATYISLDPGNKLPDFELYQYDQSTTKLSDQVKGMSVLFYWSNKNEAYALRIHKTVNELRAKYPEINFIGINLDDPESKTWRETSSKFGFNKASEFQLVDKQSISKQLALKNENRSMLIGSKLIILDPNINLFHYKIETTLLGYLSR